MAIDLVIRNGKVLDGTGAPPIQADLAITQGRIAEIGSIDAPETPFIDATGLYVTPGFIDIHSHSDWTLLVDPRAVSAIHQGVTLEVIGNCGFGCFPIGDPQLASRIIYGYSDDIALDWTRTAAYFERLEAAGPAVNVLSLVPNGQLRLATLGFSPHAANADEIGKMQYLLEQALEEGAWGYSTGLEYSSESGASEAEISALCRTVARYGGLYASHTRKRDAGAVEAVEEALRTAERSGVRLQVSHLLPRSSAAECTRCIEAVDKARERGLDVAFDMHTRLFGLTYLHTLLPPWIYQSAEPLGVQLRDVAVRNRMKQFESILSAGGDWDRIVLLDNPHWPAYVRRSLADIAVERGQEPLDAAYDLLLGALDAMHELMVIIRCYNDQQQREVFSHPLCMPGSDATDLAPDGPLASSAFHGAYTWAAWFYRFMVRQKKALTPQEAIYKLTGLPASILGLSERGVLRQGARADIAIFDPERFSEQGTTFEPNQLAEGMLYVLVNGVVTLRDGALTGARGGAVLRREKRA